MESADNRSGILDARPPHTKWDRCCAYTASRTSRPNHPSCRPCLEHTAWLAIQAYLEVFEARNGRLWKYLTVTQTELTKSYVTGIPTGASHPHYVQLRSWRTPWPIASTPSRTSQLFRGSTQNQEAFWYLFKIATAWGTYRTPSIWLLSTW